MLRGIRRAGQSLVGKIIATALFVILILSFAIWGIGDIFRGGPQNNVARVGDTDIGVEQFRTAYQNELQRLNRQFGRSITPEQARAFGIDQQVLNRLVTEAVFDQRTKALGLSASDALVIRSITEEPSFQGPNGAFDRARFEQVLRDNNLSEGGFVLQQRQSVTRTHLAEAVAGNLPVPLAAREAVQRYGAERRNAGYLILPAAAAGEIPAPSAEQIQGFYNDRKGSFSAPEYRAINVIAINPASIAKPEAVADADARQRYEQAKARFGSPERRTVQQIVFPSAAEAEAAFKRIQEGATFESIATERNIAPADLELGTFTKAELLDPLVADAAFSLQQGAVSGPVEGRFGTVLVRVTTVQPEAVRPFEEVVGEIRREIASERSRQEVETLHDQIEDMRASARPLAEIAKEKNVPLIQIPAVSRAGADKGGNPVATLPEREALLAAAFASDIGVDNEALRSRSNGYVWFDVTGIEPARERPLDEVRTDVERQWREDEVSRRLAERAGALVDRLNAGEAIEAVAADAGAPAKTAADLARRQPKDDLPADAVNRVFATPVGKAGSVATGAESRAVFKVTAATVPPLVTTTEEAQRVEEQLRVAMSDDLLGQFIAEAQKTISVTVNQQALRQVVGGDI
jgi:peptidyl-prolyl cis-trans isomerase D